MIRTLILTILAATAVRAAAPAQPVPPIPCAHSLNDYAHRRPLLDALDHGFCSVEADVWLTGGQLLVAHASNEVSQARTLEALYLDPLRERVGKNGGRVYAGGPVLQLLIDIKSDPADTCPALLAALKPYEKMLTAFYPDRTETNAVTVIVSGRRSRALMESEPVRHAACEGVPADLATPSSPHFVPLVSDTWRRHFEWRGNGPMPAGDLSKLKAMVAQAHAKGKAIRFWRIPDSPAGWKQLLDAGVDWINADDLDGFRDFYLKYCGDGSRSS